MKSHPHLPTSALLIARDSVCLTASLHGRSILARTIAAFEASPLIAEVIVVLPPDLLSWSKNLHTQEGWRNVRMISARGQARQDFVQAGLQALTPSCWVFIHDAARPFVTSQLLSTGLDALTRAQQESDLVAGVIAAVPIKETIKVTNKAGTVITTPNRATLWALQTPQLFEYTILHTLYHTPLPVHSAPDEVTRCKQAGYELHLYPGSYNNMLITTPLDLIVAEALLAARGEPETLMPKTVPEREQ